MKTEVVEKPMGISFAAENTEEVRIILNDYQGDKECFDLILESFLSEREEETFTAEYIGGCTACAASVSCIGTGSSGGDMD